MKHLLLSALLCALMFSSTAHAKNEPSDSLMLKKTTSKNNTPLVSPHNNYAVGIYGSSKLPIGYQFFFNLENIGKLRANMGVLFNNQFSSHSNYDISTTIIKRSLLIHSSRFMDLTSVTIRTRKLHYMDKERVSENYTLGYSLIYNGKLNVGAGIDCNRGFEDVNGLMLSAGRFFPVIRINITGQMSVFHNQTNWRSGISKTFLLNPKSSVIYGLEVYYEEYMDYNDVNVGMIFYL
ncbi:MAG: hypothetical protein ACM3RX_02795 [Methanococcaceae archaeon]